ncbi:MAG: hypothetical protein IJR85_02440 [Synergistaceae bacterium]|nr:hypothetical protein [Synergistaceae bacterium]
MAEANDYVRKEVFDARMDRMEMLLEKTVMEIKSYVEKTTGETKAYVEKTTGELKTYVEQSTGELKAEIGEIRNDIKVLSTRVDSLEHVIGWGIGGFALVLALAAVIPAFVAFIKKLFKPSVTFEDVERMINESSARLIAELRGGQAE